MIRRTIALVAGAALGLLLWPGVAAATGGGHEPLRICHVQPRKAPVTITIDASAWPAHKAHGDALGACAPKPSPTPTPTATPEPSTTATPTVTPTPEPTPSETPTPQPSGPAPTKPPTDELAYTGPSEILWTLALVAVACIGIGWPLARNAIRRRRPHG